MKIICLLIVCAVLFAGCNNAIPTFDGKTAFKYLEEQCTFGPRNPGSKGHELCKNYIIKFMEDHGAEVRTQDFTASVRGDEFKFTNIIASYYPERPQRIFIGAHWDTRPWADRDADSTKHNTPILGANDAASGVAVLLELATILQLNEPPIYGYDLIFFDGEDAGSYGKTKDWCLGSQYFVEHYHGKEPEFVIVIDMIGDSDLEIQKEPFSLMSSPELVDKVWKIAKQYNIQGFSSKVTTYIYDDHYPFLEAGFQAIDIIDLDYPYWHTTEDTPDKCSPKSLQSVGTMLMHLIYE